MFLSKTLRRAVTRGATFGFSVTLATLSASLLLLATSGCNKNKSETGESVIVDQNLSAKKLQEVFQGASPEVMRSIDEIKTQARYLNYDAELTELDKLSNNSSLTDAQKKAVAQMRDWVKQKQAAAAAPSQ